MGAAEDAAIARAQLTGRRPPGPLDVEVCLVFQLEDGRVTEGWDHYRDLYAWDDFWS